MPLRVALATVTSTVIRISSMYVKAYKDYVSFLSPLSRSGGHGRRSPGSDAGPHSCRRRCEGHSCSRDNSIQQVVHTNKEADHYHIL